MSSKIIYFLGNFRYITKFFCFCENNYIFWQKQLFFQSTVRICFCLTHTVQKSVHISLQKHIFLHNNFRQNAKTIFLAQLCSRFITRKVGSGIILDPYRPQNDANPQHWSRQSTKNSAGNGRVWKQKPTAGGGREPWMVIGARSVTFL